MLKRLCEPRHLNTDTEPGESALQLPPWVTGWAGLAPY